MAETKIEWTATYLPDGRVLPGYTFNGWIGCTKRGPECLHCYAERRDNWLNAGSNWGPHGTRTPTSEANWQKPLRWNREAERDGIMRDVFAFSLADVFEGREDLNAWRLRFLLLTQNTPWLRWLLLTKRTDLVPELVPAEWMDGGWPPNVALGTTVGHPRSMRRVSELLTIPASMRFLSCEPLLDSISLRVVGYGPSNRGFVDALTGTTEYEGVRECSHAAPPLPGLNWVIVGGESGPHARPMHPDWARSLRDQCQAADVNFFFKQWGEHEYRTLDPERDYTHAECILPDGRRFSYSATVQGRPETTRWVLWADRPRDGWVQVEEIPAGAVECILVGKKVAGRLLDGREWNEKPAAPLPEVAHA
jgi:protein gp37